MFYFKGLVMFDYLEVYNKVAAGGQWLGKARGWMQSNVPRGDTLTWGSAQPVSIPFYKLEDLALQTAVAAVIEDRQRREGPGTPMNRLDVLLNEMQKRFPHPNPLDSTKTYEQYFIEWLDENLKAEDANLPRGWVVWDGTGDHPTGDTKVHYRMRDGDVSDFDAARAGDLDWVHTDKKWEWEIVAYKVVDNQT